MSPLPPEDVPRGQQAVIAFIRWLAQEVAAEFYSQNMIPNQPCIRPLHQASFEVESVEEVRNANVAKSESTSSPPVGSVGFGDNGS